MFIDDKFREGIKQSELKRTREALDRGVSTNCAQVGPPEARGAHRLVDLVVGHQRQRARLPRERAVLLAPRRRAERLCRTKRRYLPLAHHAETNVISFTTVQVFLHMVSTTPPKQ